MPQKVGYIALVVHEYDETIAFYTNKLKFQLIEDTNLGNGQPGCGSGHRDRPELTCCSPAP